MGAGSALHGGAHGEELLHQVCGGGQRLGMKLRIVIVACIVIWISITNNVHALINNTHLGLDIFLRKY